MLIAANAQAASDIDWGDKTCNPLQLTRSKISHPQVNATGLKVEDLTYSACDGKTITAYLISPDKLQPGAHPAILYVHWFDPRVANSNREEFVVEAVEFAKKGGVALLVSTFWSVPGGYYERRRWQDDYANTINQLRDLKHALTILREQPAVDKQRIAYVGHDYGAVFGSMLTPEEPELAAWVFIAGTSDISSWYLYGSASGVPKGNDLTKFAEQFAPIQPYVQLKKATAPVLLQYAITDEFISDEQKQLMRSAAPTGSLFKLYPSGHAMDLPQIREDREHWLAEKLQIKNNN